MLLTPVSESASRSEILPASVIAPFSNWKPSRGPTSLILTVFGRSLMATSFRAPARPASRSDDLSRRQGVDLVPWQPELPEHLAGVLAQPRRRAPQAHVEAGAAHRQL